MRIYKTEVEITDLNIQCFYFGLQASIWAHAELEIKEVNELVLVCT